MFCPECGEVIGLGPLDLRRTRHTCNDGIAKIIGRWLRTCLRRAKPRKD